jgi:GNAT superfamily N-acetyltransferase
LISASLVGAASENLVDTYLRLGLAVGGAKVSEEESFVECLGPFDHPICNFAARLRIDPWSARRLRDIAASRVSFNVYGMPGDSPEHHGELLGRAGFQLSYELVQMIAERPEPGPPVEIRLAQSSGDRTKVARFMCEQFFYRQTEAFRRRIADATAGAAGLELFDLPDRGHPIAAVMLGHAAGVLGVYNLCVASARRGRGIGRAVLDWTLELARETGQAVTLQCDPQLEDWYGYRGFVSTGRVSVYTLPKRRDDDIIL